MLGARSLCVHRLIFLDFFLWTRKPWVHVYKAAANRNAIPVLVHLCMGHLPEKKDGRPRPSLHRTLPLRLHPLSRRSTSRVASASPATTPLVVKSTRSRCQNCQCRAFVCGDNLVGPIFEGLQEQNRMQLTNELRRFIEVDMRRRSATRRRTRR